MDNFIAGLMVPITLINMFGGIIAAIWLLFIGKWSVVLFGIIIGLVSTYLIGFAMFPSFLLSAPAIRCIEKGNSIFGHFLLFLSHLYTMGLLWYWSIMVFGFFLSYSGRFGEGTFPLLLWAYGVATSPVGHMASKDRDNFSFATTISTFCTMLGSLVFMIMYMLNFDPGVASIAYLVIMLIGLFALLVLSVQMSTAIRMDNNNYKEL